MSLDQETIDRIAKYSAQSHPKDASITYSYGTAGFRLHASKLDSVLFRVGLLAALRSKRLNGQVIGVMVTASHNPEHDNGVKLVDPHGEMLESNWEILATSLANAQSEPDLLEVLEKLIADTRTDVRKKAKVVYAYDTRPSCPQLVKALEDGLACFDTETVNAGLATTPQLHYLVRALNTAGQFDAYGEPTEEGYYHKLAKAFKSLNSGKAPLGPLTVDCANGVGAVKLKQLAEALGDEVLEIKIVKDDIKTKGALNHSCGADYVKTNQKAPPGINLVSDGRYCSFDGDADRIVFYYQHEGAFKLLDGDKIAGLVAGFFTNLVHQAGLKLQVGVVQTAYANGSSTNYLKNVLKLPVRCVPTGVKHLHHAAERYDIGVYFEANGHGTVLFSSDATHELSTHSPSTPAQQTALKHLKSLSELINQTVGDAMSDLLLVETILLHRQASFAAWDSAYTDLPNRLVKIIVPDRNLFTTTDAERKLVNPAGLQEKIDETVQKYQLGRSFVRPSGTEDCVRVYAEAATRAEADELAYKIGNIVSDEAALITTPGYVRRR